MYDNKHRETLDKILDSELSIRWLEGFKVNGTFSNGTRYQFGNEKLEVCVMLGSDGRCDDLCVGDDEHNFYFQVKTVRGFLGLLAVTYPEKCLEVENAICVEVERLKRNAT